MEARGGRGFNLLNNVQNSGVLSLKASSNQLLLCTVVIIQNSLDNVEKIVDWQQLFYREAKKAENYWN